MFKDLCFLHAQDASVEADGPMLELLNGNAPLSWRDLQRVLCEEVREAAVAQFQKKGRLTKEQSEFAGDALSFLRERDPIFCTGIHDDIYHLVWSRGHEPEAAIRPLPGLYRGHRDFRWRLESSLARPGADGLQVSTLAHRMRTATQFVEELRKRQAEFFERPPSDEELVAVAQHYGFTTGMLDFTRSLKIAAFFATSGAAKEGDVGAIFRLQARDVEVPVQGLRESPSFGDFDLLRATTVRLGKLRLVEPALADPDNRIARQQGVFVTDFHPRDFQHILGEPILFNQIPGEVFEDPVANIRTQYLLGDDTPLAQFAKEVQSAFESNVKPREPARTLPAIHDVILPDAGLLGSNGGALQAVLTDGQDFMNRLESVVEEFEDAKYMKTSLAAVLDAYFSLSRIRADVGQNASENIRPLHEAIHKLALLSQVEESRLWSVAAPHLPAELRATIPNATSLAWTPSAQEERLSASVVLYLAAWERLQFVDGEAARNTVEEAMGLLRNRRIEQILSRRG